MDSSAAAIIAQEEVKYLESEKENLAKTVAELQDKLKKTDQNKEHWKLEFQLLQMKHEKIKNNLDQLNALNSSGGVDGSVGEEAGMEDSNKVSLTYLRFMFDIIVVTPCFLSSVFFRVRLIRTSCSLSARPS